MGMVRELPRPLIKLFCNLYMDERTGWKFGMQVDYSKSILGGENRLELATAAPTNSSCLRLTLALKIGKLGISKSGRSDFSFLTCLQKGFV